MCPTTHGFVYTIVMVLQSLFSLSVKVPRNATALKRWTLMDSRWKRKEDSLGSPVDRVRSRARSEIKSMPVLLMGPNVSRASGMKTCVLESSWYLACFLVAAVAAAAPAVVDVLAIYDAARAVLPNLCAAAHKCVARAVEVCRGRMSEIKIF